MPELIVTVEHAHKYIPEELYNRMCIPDIEEHRYYDKGALEAAEVFAKVTSARMFTFPVSRLLVDGNRSITNRSFFSKYARNLSEAERLEAVYDYYIPFRRDVFKAVSEALDAVHLSFHSFTDVYEGVKRDYDIGILFDPKRSKESVLAHALKKFLSENTQFKVVLNRPYKGTSDGHTKSLRTQFSDGRYVGLELEFSHRMSVAHMCSVSEYIAEFFIHI